MYHFSSMPKTRNILRPNSGSCTIRGRERQRIRDSLRTREIEMRTKEEASRVRRSNVIKNEHTG